MRRRFHTFLLLFGWLLASGTHWDLLQSYAWTRMVVSYAEDMTVLEAVKETFTPTNLCGMCQVVRAAKEQETTQGLTGTSLEGKGVILLPLLAEVRLCPPAKQRQPTPVLQAQGIARGRPAVPPPRDVA